MQLLKLKLRPQRKGLILIAANYRQLKPFLQPITPVEQMKLQKDGAQAVTYLMPVRKYTPRWLRGAHDTLAVRLTAHAFAKQLCQGVRSALVSTSANRSGLKPARTYAECLRLFGNRVWVLPGLVGKRKQPSTILSWADGRIVR
jgi:L-threonylcarbamoyladenylate synthase